MNTVRSLSDQAAVGLSLMCTIHCLMLPLVLAVLPSTMALTIQSEAFHLFMVLMVIPLSVFALFVGCKEHKRYRVLVLGTVGVVFLLFAVFFGHDVFGELGEKLFTVIGSVCIAVGHIWNYHLCQHDEQCGCEC